MHARPSVCVFFFSFDRPISYLETFLQSWHTYEHDPLAPCDGDRVSDAVLSFALTMRY